MTGEPGRFYAIQIVAIDNREDIRPPKDTRRCVYWHDTTGLPVELKDLEEFCKRDKDSAAIYYAGNYFRAWQAGGPPPQPRCPRGSTQCPDDTPDDTPEPSMEAQLLAPHLATTRQVMRPQIRTRTQYGGGPEQTRKQAAFAKLVRLQHFSPQLTYNGARGQSAGRLDKRYGLDYVTYHDGDPGHAHRTWPAAGMGPDGQSAEQERKRSAGPRASQFLDFARLPKSPEMDPSTSFMTSRDLWDVSWLRPTLKNACPGPDDPALSGNWPAEGDDDASVCRVGIRNAWDDVFSARMNYEARWAPQTNQNPDIGVVEDDYLRCDDQDSADKRARDCRRPEHSLEPLPRSEDQWAQGYLFTDSNRPGGGAAANVILDTNRPDKLSPWSMHKREGGEHVGTISGSNSISGKPEMFFCKQGGPGGARRYNGDNPLTPNGAVSNGTFAGDSLAHDGHAFGPGSHCQGWANEWRWDHWDENLAWTYPGDGSYDVSAATCKIWGNIQPPRGTESQYRIRWPDAAEIEAAGGRGSYAAFNGNAGLLPYVGRKPGANFGNTKPCHYFFIGGYERNVWAYNYIWRGAPNNADYCRWNSRGQALSHLPNAPYGYSGQAESGNAYACTGSQRGRYRLGWWQRTSPTLFPAPREQNNCKYYVRTGENMRTYDPATGDEEDYSRGLYDSPGDPDDLGVGHFIAYGNQRQHKRNLPVTPCIDRIDGWIYGGNWHVSDNLQVGRGWGYNNADASKDLNGIGTRLQAGGYVASFPFQNVDAREAESITWALWSSYDGHREWDWRTRWKRNNPDSTAQVERIFAPRNTR